MAILRAIGAFFAKIWRWIKETAWVQPLLIVGLIFGVVFSIPAIVDAVKKNKAEKNSSEAFYTQFQLSLVNGEDSKADELTNKIEKKNMAGDKFFLAFVAQDCSVCEEVKGGFETLKDNFEKKGKKDGIFMPNDKKDFKMYTIFTDEKMTDDSDDEKTAFVQYLERHADFFGDVADTIEQTEYYANGHINDDDIEAVRSISDTDFLTPTIFLVDFTGEYEGVTEVMFGVEESDKEGQSSSDYKRAQTLLDCWNHEGEFAKKD